MKGKDLKQAKVYKVQLDVERPLTFDFNALCELQEFYADPFQAVAGLEAMNFKAMRALLYSTLVAGALIEDENAEFDLTINKVGVILGQLMQDEESFGKVFEKVAEAITDFFPEPEVEQETADTESKKDEVEEKN
jgi:hypothetical protein